MCFVGNSSIDNLDIQVESTTETEAEYNFSTSFECSCGDGPITLDDVASKPILS